MMFLGKREILFTEMGNWRRKRFWKADNMFTFQTVCNAFVKSKPRCLSGLYGFGPLG